MHKEKSCGAVIFHIDEQGNRKYLLLHYAAGHWDFPKGKKEPGENDIDTVRREAKEETDIKDLNFIEGFKELINYTYMFDEEPIYKDVVYHLAETEENNIIISDEHIGFVWMSFEHAFKKLTYDNAKKVLSKADKYMNKKF
jgi:bis(5'-nucleosidyl)-tetraphosphatase